MSHAKQKGLYTATMRTLVLYKKYQSI